MRVATANTYDVGINNLQRRQNELSEAQVQLTSGKKVNRASDDPVAAARAERALAGEARVNASQRSVEASQTVMIQTEAALGDANELLQQARETLVAAGNATYGPSERSALAETLKSIRAQLLEVANRSDGAGTYLFGGQGSSQAPFVDARPSGERIEQTGVSYVGNTGTAVTDSSTALPLSLDGSAIWTSARTGNGVFETRAGTVSGSAWIDAGLVADTNALGSVPPSSYTITFDTSGTAPQYTVVRTPLPPADTTPVSLPAQPYTSGKAIVIDGMSVKVTGVPAQGDQFSIVQSTSTLNTFGAIDKAISDLTSKLSSTQLTQAGADNLRNIDAVMGKLQSARAVAGEALARIDAKTTQLDTQKLNHQVERSNAEGLDMVEAISEFQTKQSGYDAAMQSYAMVQRMSLFQYINA